MSIIFVDREAAFPHKYKIIPEDGSAPYYVVLERADEPLTPGTPLNAETFNGMVGDYEALVAAARKDSTDHIKNKENPHGVTIAQIGAAPSGHGLGNSVLVTDINAVTAPGWYHVSTNMTINNVSANYWFMHVAAYGTGSQHCVQTLYPVGKYGLKFRRVYTSQVWGEWESENPYMTPGIEYRTPERWWGKEVYTRIISATWVAGGTITLDFTDNDTPHKWAGKVGTFVLPYTHGGSLSNDNSAVVTVRKNENNLIVGMYGGSAVSGTLYLQMWYTKANKEA